jgi:hypothetical protein
MQKNGQAKPSSAKLSTKDSIKGRNNRTKEAFCKEHQLNRINEQFNNTLKTNKIKPEKLHIVSIA